MIYADTTALILGSPVISVILGGIGSGIFGLALLIWRMLSRISLLETQLADIGKDLQRLDRDIEMFKWVAINGARAPQQHPSISQED